MSTISDKVEVLALRLCDLDGQIKIEEQKLKELKEEYNYIKTKDLADLMEFEGHCVGSKIVLKNGRTIVVKEFFTAGIPSETRISREKDPCKQDDLIEKKRKCLSWLDNNNLGDIVKNKVIADFGREDTVKATMLMNLLINREIAFKNDKNVHPSTLKAALKDCMKQGVKVPYEVFSINSGTIIEVK